VISAAADLLQTGIQVRWRDGWRLVVGCTTGRAPGARGPARRCVRKIRRVCVDSIHHTTSTSTISTTISSSSRRRLAL